VPTSERVRNWGWKTSFLRLYLHLKPDAIANQETRGMIRGYILVHPGDSYTDIKQNLNLSSGALTYHLDVLEREKLIQSQNRGSRKLYFPAGVPMPGDGGGLHELQLRMLKVVDERPGIPLRDLAGTLGVSPELVRYHLRTLEERRLAVTQRVGLSTQVFRVAGAEPKADT